MAWVAACLPALVICACGPAEDEDSELSVRELPVSRELPLGAAPSAYTLFEADPVRPIAVLERSGIVAVTNTVDNSLELLRPRRGSVSACGSVQVGLQPVAVALVHEGRSRAELWVVNQLSDSISVVGVDLDNCRADVTRTLHVGDEPRDIVVARDSDGHTRVFVAVAHRGQHHPLESARLGSDLSTPPEEKSARGLADVLVFDAASPDSAPSVVNLFSDKPRALALGEGVVYAASYFSGNRTTAIPAETVTLRGLSSLNAILARDAAGNPIEHAGELELSIEAAAQVAIEGGLPAVAGRGRCFADPRREDEDFSLQRVCVQTNAQNQPEHAFIQQSGVVHPSCQCTSGDGTLQPSTGIIVQFFDTPEACAEAFTTFPDGARGCWLDAALGGVRTPALAAVRQPLPMAWNQQVKFSLPDRDVFAIDVDDLDVVRSFSGVGTVLFGLAVQPRSGKLFVTNTEAQNLTRFEGHAQSSSSSVIGHLHESRITVIDPAVAAPAEAVEPVHLNTHIDYGRCCDKDEEENAKSFAFPTSGAFSADGARFFFSALGSDKIGIVNADVVASGFDHDRARHRGELREIVFGDDIDDPSGPVGLAVDTLRGRLYVKTQFDNELVVIDTERERITGRLPLPSPEPESVTRGRSVLYNARLTSSHGDSACASCHVFGDFDGLAWDLGDPDGATVKNPGPFALPGSDIADFRSNKGPMSTQTLRGLANHGPLHWRGDRTRRFQAEPGEQPGTGSFDEHSSFSEFDVAIRGLNGNDVLLAPEVFAKFADFALQLSLPPNPIRHLDNTLTPDQSAARALYFGCTSMTDAQFAARTCSGLDGTRVDVDAATADCLCARNPIVNDLRELPRVQAFAQLFAALFDSGELRARLLLLASDTSELPESLHAEVAVAAASFAAGSAALSHAELATDARGLISESLATALSALSSGLLQVLGASLGNETSVSASIAQLFFDSIPPDAIPPEIPRDASGLAVICETIAEVSATSELARTDELARGTSDFRNLLSDCDLAAAPACNLRLTDALTTCNGCHRLDPNGNAEFGVSQPGFFGTDGTYSFEGESQVFKIPHLRNGYQKAGMFGASPNPFFLPESVLGPRKGGFFSPDTQYTGPQVRGFGFFHDGVVDTLHRFHGASAFVAEPGNEGGLDAFLPRELERAACVQRFRQAPSRAFDAAPAELRPFLGLCIEGGPLPASCFSEASSEDCLAALPAAAAAVGFPAELADALIGGVVPLCFQLGSMLEDGSPNGVCYPRGLRERAQMESFMLAFDSNLKPMVGQQVTLSSGRAHDPLLISLLAAADRHDCDLALRQNGRGFVLTRPDSIRPGRSKIEDRRGRERRLGDLSRDEGPVTLTCLPPAIEQAEARRFAFARERSRF